MPTITFVPRHLKGEIKLSKHSGVLVSGIDESYELCSLPTLKREQQAPWTKGFNERPGILCVEWAVCAELLHAYPHLPVHSKNAFLYWIEMGMGTGMDKSNEVDSVAVSLSTRTVRTLRTIRNQSDSRDENE